MIFLQPGLLWGLLALSIPVLIHLFNFQKTERIIFANTRLLNEVAQKTQKARQLKNWILLLFRMLAMAALIFAFAQPVIQNESITNPEKGLPQVGVYIDNSVSMFISKDEKAPFDLAIASAKGIPGSFGRKGWFQLLTNQFDSKHLWTSANGLGDQMLEVGPSTVNRELSTITNRLARQLTSQNLGDQKLEILISDFQKTSTGKPELLSLDSGINHRLIAIQQNPVSNVFVDSAWLPSPISFGRKSQELKIMVSQSGIAYQKPVNLQLYANGSLISGKTFSLSDQKSHEVVLPFRIKSNEMLRCTLTVDDQMVTFDNNFYFTLKAPPITQIYILDNSSNPYIKNVFKNKGLFKIETGKFNSVDFQKLKDANLVVLNEPESLDEAVMEALLQNLESGGSVLVIPNLKFDPDWLMKAGMKILPPSGSEFLKPTDWKIKLPTKTDRFFDGVFSEIAPSASKPFARPDWICTGSRNYLSYESGNAYLSGINVGNGKIFVLAAPINGAVGNIQQHPLFIPMMFKIAFSGSRLAELPLYCRTSSSLIGLAPDSLEFMKDKPLTLSNGNSKIMVSQQKKGNRILIDMPSEQMQPGFWEVFSEGRFGGIFALNRDKGESIMEFYSEDELKSAFASMPWVSVSSVSNEASPEYLQAEAGKGLSLWKYFICLSLLMFAGEMITAKLGNRSKGLSK